MRGCVRVCCEDMCACEGVVSLTFPSPSVRVELSTASEAASKYSSTTVSTSSRSVMRN